MTRVPVAAARSINIVADAQFNQAPTKESERRQGDREVFAKIREIDGVCFPSGQIVFEAS
jgi:hypothetical protein